MTLDELSVAPLKKAAESLGLALAEPKNPFVRDAAIQRFEYTYELAWKTLKKYFFLNNQMEIHHIRDIFREAGKQGLIESVEDWFDYQRARNRTSHTYDEKVAEEVYAVAKGFSKDVGKLIEHLERLLG